MKTRLAILALLAIASLGATAAYAQELGAFAPTAQKYGIKNIAQSGKRIHIASFNVNYQVFNARTDFKQGGSMFGGGNRGDATAKLAIALAGFSTEDLVANTDRLFADFQQTLQDNGFTLISIDDAAKAEAYEGWVRAEGGEAKRSPLPGIISVSPTGFEYMIKSVKAASKKKGAFANVAAQGRFGSLSQQLDDAIIAEVDFSIIFTEEGQSWNAGGAKIKMRPNLRLIDTYTIVNDKKKKGIISMKGAQTFDRVSSAVNFHHGKVGMGVKSAYLGTLKKPLEINGVVDEKKIVTFVRQSTDAVGASNAFYTVYSDEARETEETKTLEVEEGAYAEGTYAACKKMLLEHTLAFAKSL